MSDELLLELASYRYRPRDFAYWAFPWGEEDTELAGFYRLELWQDRMLSYIQERMQDYRAGIYMPIRCCVKSGHGVGKSGILAILNLWAMSTLEDTKGTLTAGTETQLRTKTWVEMAKWHRLFIAGPLFQLSATALFPREKGPTKEWRLDIIPWSEHNPAAFAGLHNIGKRIIACADEASEIPQIIHETAAGVETDKNTEIIRVLTGNPTDPTSFFRECSEGGRFEQMWWNMSVRSADVELTNKELIEEERRVWGEDSDYFRVRRLGEFPQQSGDSFVPRVLVEAAQARLLPEGQEPQPLIMGVDIGRKNDPTVIRFRKGLDGRTIPRTELRPKFDTVMPPTMQILQVIMQQIALYDPDTLCLDIGHIGAAIYDLLLGKGLQRPTIIPVDFGASASLGAGAEEMIRYANMRAQLWGRFRSWLQRGTLDKHAGFLEEAIAPSYKFRGETTILLESKEQVKMRLEGRSTDDVDAFVVTFAETFIPVVQHTREELLLAKAQWARQSDNNYNPFSEARIYH